MRDELVRTGGDLQAATVLMAVQLQKHWLVNLFELASNQVVLGALTQGPSCVDFSPHCMRRP